MPADGADVQVVVDASKASVPSLTHNAISTLSADG
jgi:hypothetical protein